jgi:hypothetical protein
MKIKLLKATLHNDAMYGEGSVVDMADEGRAKFFIGMGQAEAATPEAPMSKHNPPPKPLRSAQASEIGSAVGEAIVEALKKNK